jgi:hypothetical protein
MHHVTSLRSDVNEIKSVMKELATAVTRLALVDTAMPAAACAVMGHVWIPGGLYSP